MSSTVLSHDSGNALPGINLRWVNTGLGVIKEVTLIYFKNSNDAQILSVDVNPANLKYGLINQRGLMSCLLYPSV